MTSYNIPKGLPAANNPWPIAVRPYGYRAPHHAPGGPRSVLLRCASVDMVLSAECALELAAALVAQVNREIRHDR